jgi:two-component system, OmpR family, phosphate regulon sensor histidine kinase PhoR
MMTTVKRLLGERWTYLRIVYLLLAFPLGTTYFILLITGLSVGVGLSVIGVGLVILALTVVGWLFVARFERELAIHLLGAQVRPFSLPGEPLRPWPRLLKTLAEPTTWKALAYLLLEFPFGVITFTLTIVLLSVSLALIAVPFAYVANLLVGPAQIQVGSGFTLFPNNPPFGATFLLALVLGAFGIALGLGSMALLSGIGWAWGRFAEQMLGVDLSRLQLAAAEAEAASQRRRAERADQSRRELIVNASHELRTPIASISAHVESLQKPERQMDAESHQYLGVIETETKRLSSLVDDLLVLARADADELRLTVRAVNVPELADRVCTAMAPLARQERNLSLVHTSPPDMPPALADPDRLAQVLANLVRNAVNHTPDGGIITVTTQRGPDAIIISVADTGIGIDPQDLPRIFERFYRTDQSRARDSGGSGLGLAIVRELLTAMGGTINAESTLGRGSTFRIRLRQAV